MDGRITAYDEDVFLWSQEQAAALRSAAAAGSNLPVDWENVAEEIESVGRSDLKSLNSALMRVIEHLLKLEYSPAVDPRAGWEDSVDIHRYHAIEELRSSPSLWRKADVPEIYAEGRRQAARGLSRDGVASADLPVDCPWTLEQLLDRDFWPVNRHGLE